MWWKRFKYDPTIWDYVALGFVIFAFFLGILTIGILLGKYVAIPWIRFLYERLP